MTVREAYARWEHPEKLQIRDLSLPSRRTYWLFKQSFDFVFSFLLLVLLSPLFGLIALIIKLDDPTAPVLYKQNRCGRSGKQFVMYKFRTMRPDAEKLLEQLKAQNEMAGPAFKMKHDPRITRVGHFLRASSLDELPQFINILKGEMSIVGPRPPLPSEVLEYNEYQYQRLYVTPGLTCYWQVSPNRNDMTFDQWLEMDIRYVIDRSVLVDLKIIWLTVLAVLRFDGR